MRRFRLSTFRTLRVKFIKNISKMKPLKFLSELKLFDYISELKLFDYISESKLFKYISVLKLFKYISRMKPLKFLSRVQPFKFFYRIIKTVYYSNVFKDSRFYPFGLKTPGFLESFPLFQIPIISFLIRILRLIGWIVHDIAIAIKNSRDKSIHLYGIWCYVGLPGAGKTMSLVHYLDEQRRRYGDRIYIITNFYYAGEDKHLSNWDMLLEEYDRAVIFAWDELQNEFNSREYRKFPMRLVHELTQNRKGNGKQVVYTTQTFTAVDNNFRNLTIRVIDCRTYLKRLTRCRHYRREFYEARAESKSIEKKVKLKPLRKETFIQTNFIRSRYDSYQRLDYIKNLTYEGLRPDDTKNIASSSGG